MRPNWKERYPLTPIERYAAWTRDDGLPFDPWMRVHARLGAEDPAPGARVAADRRTVAEWEEWTAMAFPESGEYVFPHGLAPARRRPRGGHRRVLGAERLDAPPRRRVIRAALVAAALALAAPAAAGELAVAALVGGVLRRS